MGHQLLYGFCRRCNKMWGKRNGKTIFDECICSIMKTCKSSYICETEADSIEKILISNQFNLEQKEWYKAKVISRIEELKPLFNECIKKNIFLGDLDNDINNEWNRLVLMKSKYCL